jgi:hypothetical protein
MSSRQEEKEKRRQERLEAEQAASSAQSRTRLLQGALAGLLVIGVVVGIVLAASGGGDKGGGGHQPTTTNAVKVPPAKEKDLAKAASAAGCKVLDPKLQGAGHVTTPVKYKSNPPTSGPHNPEPAGDGIYDASNSPTAVHYVHALEHGRVNIQYKVGLPKAQIDQLETVASEPLNGLPGYKVLLFQNDTKMPYAVAATAWGHLLGCPEFSPAIFDAIRDFRVKYVDKGPEVGIPPTNG